VSYEVNRSYVQLLLKYEYHTNRHIFRSSENWSGVKMSVWKVDVSAQDLQLLLCVRISTN